MQDRREKPFALAWLKLIQDAGTIVPDGAHELLVYKVRCYTGYLFTPYTLHPYPFIPLVRKAPLWCGLWTGDRTVETNFLTCS